MWNDLVLFPVKCNTIRKASCGDKPPSGAGVSERQASVGGNLSSGMVDVIKPCG